MGDFAKGFQLCLTIPSLLKVWVCYESLRCLCICYMYWILYAPASCRQWSKETLVCMSLVCFYPSFLEICLVNCPSSPKKYRQCHQAVDLGDSSMADVVVLNLCTLALQTLDCRVPSGNNNRNKFILFQRQRRPEYIMCKVTLFYYYYYYYYYYYHIENWNKSQFLFS